MEGRLVAYEGIFGMAEINDGKRCHWVRPPDVDPKSVKVNCKVSFDLSQENKSYLYAMNVVKL